MLPKPQCTFTIPSLYDDIELNGRLYFPKLVADSQHPCISGFAIFAHPYTPLGGSWDDPIVHTVGAVLLREGFVLCTFNFRGAAGTNGRTSWTGKAEVGDYASFYALISAMVANREIYEFWTYSQSMFPLKRPTLILGGYSYGSMIAAHLPEQRIIVNIMSAARKGTAEHEIAARATELSKTLLGYLESHVLRGRSSLRTAEIMGSPGSNRGVAIGGYESDTASQRISRESSRRSVDVELVRKSIDKAKNRFGSRGSNAHRLSEPSPVIVQNDFDTLAEIAYLLISPLLPPISTLTTVFVRLAFERRDKSATMAVPEKQERSGDNLCNNRSCAIYGTKDVFTSARKLRNWAEDLQSVTSSLFTFREIEDVGHFWQESGAEAKLCNAVGSWLYQGRLVNSQRGPQEDRQGSSVGS